MSAVESPMEVVPRQPGREGPRGRLLAGALFLGPLLVLVSALLNHTPASQDAADVLAAVRAHRGQHLAEVLLEMSGLAITLTGSAVAALRLRDRGASLAAVGAMGCILGVVGFTMVNAEGMVVNALAGMPERAAAVDAVDATNTSPAVYVAFPLIMLGEVGVVAVLAAFRRAGRLATWPAVLAFASLVVDFSSGSRALLVCSDVLLLFALWWLAADWPVRRRRADRGHRVGRPPGALRPRVAAPGRAPERAGERPARGGSRARCVSRTTGHVAT